MSVDLPEPEGPQTTTTSPFSTLAVQFESTLKAGVYHLSTPMISITGLRTGICGRSRGAVISAVIENQPNRILGFIERTCKIVCLRLTESASEFKDKIFE
jgi:hypothetical protein